MFAGVTEYACGSLNFATAPFSPREVNRYSVRTIKR